MTAKHIIRKKEIEKIYRNILKLFKDKNFKIEEARDGICVYKIPPIKIYIKERKEIDSHPEIIITHY